ncbi:alpha-L-rhamnosidase-like protein [Pontibacter ummariensis]|uniref:Alpha-L-rhamnosidase N-terminal domain-containing protein n=1 Tax=Pontibacter ummariensis TaxID=1610492 RepID=A0A239G386_9BACT|nr:family 78 glycoside hydrolase catalytic domain [Pontibacter ummariensis]PRY11650.1 alpha-L-rhamnosidase-like protein [Pontibacter ummariensis]SNS63796.1 Alpha-L-rhamnosidase N-terminal domain-containing protein [Pontibacter ummariensis]
MKKPAFVLSLLVALLPLLVLAQIPNPVLPAELTTKPWPAQWIAVAGEPAKAYGVYHFRKSIDLPAKPASFLVHVSGDNRYKLFVNGQQVCFGPARSDVFHWNFETVDLGPFLKQGNNTLAAVVWNYGEAMPVAQMSYRTGFILQGNGAAERIADTNSSWKGMRSKAYTPIHTNLHTYFVVGPGENIDAADYPWGWEAEGFDDSQWTAASTISPGLVGGLFEPWYEGWHLQARTIPAMELSPERLASVRKATGVSVPKSFPQKAAAFTIPAHTKATLILDQGVETTAFPVLSTSGGQGASISLRYAESLFNDEGKSLGETKQKGDRNEVAGKVFIGYEDKFILEGGEARTFEPLWWRTYRYLQVTVETKDQPLTINDLYGLYTGYPFKMQARFEAGRPELQKILEVGWRTARLCAHETYMDCPYYEQLQYVGDTRIQALVSLFNSGDDRLVRNAINQVRQSHGLSGITQSRYPSHNPQYIPPFSLWWIGMVNDYWKYRGDEAFIQEQLPVTRAVISFFESKQQENSAMGMVPYWNFTDWAEAPGWKAGMAPKAEDGTSAALDLQLLLAYKEAMPLEQVVGLPAFAQHYEQKIAALKQTIRELYWDEGKGLFADTPNKNSFSQHINTFAVLGGVVEGEEARHVMEKVLRDTSLTQGSIYFKYYLHQAVAKAGLGDQYLQLLDEWHTQLAKGLTTWAEQPEPTRSDCHAWGASPNIELYRIVLGIDSNAPGFSKVRIAPNLGNLKEASGSIPHPQGQIKVKYSLNRNNRLKAEISLPDRVTGTLVWKGKEVVLTGGEKNSVVL